MATVDITSQVSPLDFAAHRRHLSPPPPDSTLSMDHHHDSMPGMAVDSGSSTVGTTDTSQAMAMTFFQSITTPLLFRGTAPSSQGQYTGACILLAVLAVLTCGLINLKGVLQRSVWRAAVQSAEESLLSDKEKAAAVEARGRHHDSAAETGMVRSEMRSWWAAWRGTSLGQRVGMASFEMLLVGMGYVL